MSSDQCRRVARKTGPVDRCGCDAVDSLSDALDCQFRNAARWVADSEARNEVSDLPLDFDRLQKEGMSRSLRVSRRAASMDKQQSRNESKVERRTARTDLGGCESEEAWARGAVGRREGGTRRARPIGPRRNW